MRLERMTWQEVERLDKAGAVAVLPLGSLEQHGHHLPLGTDYFLARALGEAVEEELPDCVVLLPAVWMGHSPHHMRFPGTVSVHHQTYADLLVQAVLSLMESGFAKIAMLNAHGGNGLPMQIALQELKNRTRDANNLSISAFNYWNLAADEMRNIRESAPGGMGHACEMETSVMQYIHGEMVRTDRIVRDGSQPPLSLVRFDMLAGSPVQIVYDFHEITGSGTFGDPEIATAEKGKRFFDASVRAVKAYITELSELKGAEGSYAD